MKLVIATLLVAACSDHSRTEVVDREPPHQRRVIDPPSANVRLRPPYAIHADAVGPYKLGAQLESVLAQLSSGPRLAQYDIPTVVHQSVLRADDTILIGGEPRGAVGIIAVVGGDVAKTESGIHVGSSRDELVRALGPLVEDPDRARDPHVLAPSALPNLRAVMAGDEVAALAIQRDGEISKRTTDCTRPLAKDDAFGACLASGEIITIDGDDLNIRGADDKLIGTKHVTGLVFAAALRDGDHDDLVAISRTEDAQQRMWWLAVWRLEAGKLAPAIEVQTAQGTALYQLTSANVRWIGAELHDVELYLELTSRPDTIEVGGLLTTRVGDRLRDVLAISPVSVARKRGKPASGEASDAGVPQEPPDSGVGPHR